MNLEAKAHALATKAHEGQIRKGTGEPYITHPAGVADFCKHYYDISEAQICGAWLHDVIEDTTVTYDDIKEVLNEEIADIVLGCTDTPGLTGNARRKAKLEFISSLPVDHPSRVVMLEDTHHNMASLVPLVHNAVPNRLDAFTYFGAKEDIIYYYYEKAHRLSEGMKFLNPRSTMDDLHWCFLTIRRYIGIYEQKRVLW